MQKRTASAVGRPKLILLQKKPEVAFAKASATGGGQKGKPFEPFC
jgi:hypothetical protein